MAKAYSVVGYDKDSDVYESLITTCHCSFSHVIKITKYLAEQNLRRKSNNEPFDWLSICDAGNETYPEKCI